MYSKDINISEYVLKMLDILKFKKINDSQYTLQKNHFLYKLSLVHVLTLTSDEKILRIIFLSKTNCNTKKRDKDTIKDEKIITFFENEFQQEIRKLKIQTLLHE